MRETGKDLPYARLSKRRRPGFDWDIVAFGLAALLLTGIWATLVVGTNAAKIVVETNFSADQLPPVMVPVYAFCSHSTLAFWSGCTFIWLVFGACYSRRRRSGGVGASAVLAYGLAIMFLLYGFVGFGTLMYSIRII